MSKFVIECPHCGTYQEVVTFYFGYDILNGKIGIVDKYGTFLYEDGPSYDILSIINGEETLIKHIPEYLIIDYIDKVP